MAENTALPNRWMIASMGVLIQLCLGTAYAWSYFQNLVMKVGGWSNAQAAWTFSILIFMLGVAAAWGGMNLAKFGPKVLAMIGGALYGIGWMIGAYALSVKSLPLLYVFGFIGGIGLGLGYVTPVATASKCSPAAASTARRVVEADARTSRGAAACKAVSEGRRDFVRIAVYGDGEHYCYPCGACRQFLAEFAPDMEVLSAMGGGRYVSNRLSELMPYTFNY